MVFFVHDIYACVNIHACIHVYVYACVCVRIYIYVYTYMCIYISVCVGVCACVCLYFSMTRSTGYMLCVYYNTYTCICIGVHRGCNSTCIYSYARMKMMLDSHIYS